jgi:hypothetical protein
MKKIAIFCLLVMMGYAPAVSAQTKGKAGTTEKATQQPATVKRSAATAQAPSADTVTLSSISANQAYGTTQGQLSISDPTIRGLNEQAAGSTGVVSPSGIVGMPRRAYGFNNGRILLRKTTSLSSGTSFGSGAVGTGTSLLGVGAGENAIGVNGKNPHAGPSLWGSRVPYQYQPLADTTRRMP